MADKESVALITPEEAAKVAEVSEKVAAVVAQGGSLPVRNDAEAQAAVEFLGGVKRMARDADKARRFLVDPLNAHVKAINDQFRPNMDALSGVERVVKAKVLEYRQEAERKAEAERQRVAEENARRQREAEEEQRRKAAEAQAERERAAREAEAARAAAAKAERERLEAMERDRESRRARIARLPVESLKRIAAGGSEDAPLAQAELDAQRAAREAQEAAARAAAAEEAAREAEEAARATPAEQPVALEVAGPQKLAGSATRKRWTFEVTDPEKLPMWALTPDPKEIRRRVQHEGLRECAGLRIYQTEDLAVRAGR